MIEPAYFEQADQELEELNRKRDDFMADATPVYLEDTPKLIELGEKLRTEDTSISKEITCLNCLQNDKEIREIKTSLNCLSNHKEIRGAISLPTRFYELHLSLYIFSHGKTS